MGEVKKTFMVDEAVYARLQASAASDGRSVTKQIDHLLRRALGMLPVGLVVPDGVVRDLARPALPDPKVKVAPRRSSRG